MATVATISVNFAQYDSTSFTLAGVNDRSINPRTLSQYCLGSASADLSYLGGFVKKTGDTMSGPLFLPSSPTPSQGEAARVSYLETRVASLSSTINDSNAGGFVRITGSTMVGSLILNTSEPSLSLQASSKGYVDSRISSLSSTTEVKLVGDYLPLNGGTMRGPINMNGYKIVGFPTTTTFSDGDLVTKKYVDSTIASADTRVGTALVAAQAAQTTANNAVIAAANANANANSRVARAGDTMTGSLVVQGNITATGDVTAFSDSRLKKNVNIIENALEKVLKLKGVTFEKISDNKKSLGVIAQDVMEVIPEVVLEGSDGYLSVAYGNIVGVLIEAVKELSNKVEKLEKELNK